MTIPFEFKQRTILMAPYESCEAIMGFRDDYRWLSNFWPAEVSVGDVTFPTVEHGFVASKLEPGKGMPWTDFLLAVRKMGPSISGRLSADLPEKSTNAQTGEPECAYGDLLAFIARFERPGQVKKFGRFIPLRPDWEEGAKIEAMRDLTRQKYEIPELREKLLATKARPIFEVNTWGDRFWGMVPDKDKGPELNAIGDFHGTDNRSMTGGNALGAILQDQRTALQFECSRGMVKGRLTINLRTSPLSLKQIKDCLLHAFGEYSGTVTEAGPIVSFRVDTQIPNGDIDNVWHPRARSILTNLGCPYIWTSKGGPDLPPGGVAYDPASLRKPTSFFHTGLDDHRLTVLPTMKNDEATRDNLAEAQYVGRELREDEANEIEKATRKGKLKSYLLSAPIGVLSPKPEPEPDLFDGMTP